MSELKAAAKVGVRWTAASSITTAGMQFLRTALMARFFLSPTDFGHFAVVSIVMMLFMAVTDLGLAVAILRTEHLDDRKSATFLYLTTATGTILAFIVAVGASPIAAAMGDSSATNFVRMMGVMLILESASSVFVALQERSLEFRGPTSTEIISTACGLVLSVFLASSGFGVWSLVFGQISQSFVKLAINGWLAIGRISLTHPAPISSVRSDIRFSYFVLADRLLNTFGGRIDQFLLARLASIPQLGLYAVAFNYSILVMFRINSLMGRVLFPILSGASNRGEFDRLTRGFLFALQTTALVNGAFAGALIAAAPSLMPLVLGAKWQGTVSILQLLCIAGVIKTILNLSGIVILSVGKSRTQFLWNVISILVSAPIIAAFVMRWGAVGAAAGVILVELASIAPIYLVSVRPYLCISDLDVLMAAVRPILGNAIATAFVMTPGIFLSAGPQLLLIQTIIGLIAFPAFGMISTPRASMELLEWLVGHDLAAFIRNFIRTSTKP